MRSCQSPQAPNTKDRGRDELRALRQMEINMRLQTAQRETQNLASRQAAQIRLQPYCPIFAVVEFRHRFQPRESCSRVLDVCRKIYRYVMTLTFFFQVTNLRMTHPRNNLIPTYSRHQFLHRSLQWFCRHSGRVRLAICLSWKHADFVYNRTGTLTEQAPRVAKLYEVAKRAFPL